MAKGPKPTDPLERFWKHVNKNAPNGCWEWRGAKPEGYGAFRIGSRTDRSYQTIGAHCFAYLMLRGAIPKGMVLDHLCRNTACVNPEHLEPVTLLENFRRGKKPQHLRKTHCPRGHHYDQCNTYLNRQGKQECRTCHRERTRERRHSVKRRRSPYYNPEEV